jgi:hypothetical protein
MERVIGRFINLYIWIFEVEIKQGFHRMRGCDAINKITLHGTLKLKLL